MSPPPPLALDHPSWLLNEAELVGSQDEPDGPADETELEPNSSDTLVNGPESFDAHANANANGGAAALSHGAAAASKIEKKRRRPALSCEQCRRRKIRCDRGLPCVNCIKSNISPCTYAPTHIPASRAKKVAASHVQDGAPSQPAIVPARSAPVFGPVTQDVPAHAVSQRAPSVPSSTKGSHSDLSTVDALAARVQELEQKLAESFHLGGAKPKDTLKQPDGEEEADAPMKGTISKTRFFGQSHWMNGAIMFPDVIKTLKNVEATTFGPHRIFRTCKSLARTIKENRLKPLSSASLGQTIPIRPIADQLVDAYIRTFEGAIRILHVPTFRAEYERYWQNPSAANMAFIMQMQLCMALGATVHDDLFTHRASAMHWVHEAQLWILLPPEKSRMSIAGIQIMCMLTIAKATCAVGQDLTWVTTGGLVRQAMYMGLHRDPKHLANLSVYRAEMRRRLWATILELNLQSSFDAGGPPLLTSKHYDTRPPANLNDDQLIDESEATAPLENKPEDLTDMSVQLALFKSLPLRVTIIKHVNEFRSKESYPETLRLNSELTKACRTLTETLAALTYAQKGNHRTIITQFHCGIVQLFTYRCFLSLHQPMLGRAADDPTVYYSRKVSLDSSLKIAQICNLSHPRFPSAAPGCSDPATLFDRLVTNSAGLFRVVPTQTLFSVGMEYIKKKEEERDSLGGLPSMGSNDLRLVLESAVEWSKRRIRSGETNIKSYCFIAACLALADGIEKRMTAEQVDQLIVQTSEAACLVSWELLKEVADREGANANQQGVSPVSSEEPAESMEGIVAMPFDWLESFNWDGMGGMGGMGDINWGRTVPRAFGELDPTNMSQI